MNLMEQISIEQSCLFTEFCAKDTYKGTKHRQQVVFTVCREDASIGV